MCLVDKREIRNISEYSASLFPKGRGIQEGVAYTKLVKKRKEGQRGHRAQTRAHTHAQKTYVTIYLFMRTARTKQNAIQ